ncbi:hypothetical protein [Metaplanococcus flavidus]|uniref:Uncharacterized protein n=1 Tax=Metaplanococcus flavidus TaxID=569883 RepID=A0ABW3LHH0_9BACL
MIRGFQKVIEDLVEQRLEEIINSKDFISYTEVIEHDLEEKLKQLTQIDDEESKVHLLSDLQANIFDQVHLQSTIAYKTGFNDGLIFAIDTLMAPKKI